MTASDPGRLQFLHIGKTGGTFVRKVLRALPPEHRDRFRLLHHDVHIEHALETKPDLPVFFTVRRPETLFVSAFDSRQRMGRPTYDRPWSPREKIVFSVFETPNQLAEALSATDPHLRASARLSMLGINHVRKGLHWYLRNIETLERHRDAIAFVLLQENLRADLETFASRISVPLELAGDVLEERIHESPRGGTPLSETGLANIREWYRADCEMYDWCVELRGHITGSSAEQPR